MMSLSVHITILTIFCLQSAVQKKCDISTCNYESACFLQNGKATCNCTGVFYEGLICSEPINHCKKNPCRNGGICHSYPGHFYCECPKGFSAQTCTSKQNVFKGLHLHYNHMAPIGTKQLFILILQDLGDTETLLDFFTPEYIIDGMAFSFKSGHFTPSSDLKALGEQYGIHHSEEIPYSKGFYKIANGHFWKLGVHRLALVLIDSGPSAETLFVEHFDITIYDPTGDRCFPIIHLPHCLNPRKAMHIDIATFNFIEPIIEKKCTNHSSLRIKWSVRNFIDTVVLHKFKLNSSTMLTISPYTMWFEYRDDYMQSYLIQGEVEELDDSGKSTSRTIIRCYVFVESKPTTAHIIGGSYREVNADRATLIDGTHSRDHARPEAFNQKLEFEWSCASKDRENFFCRDHMSKKSTLKIPPKGLLLGFEYEYTLVVRSTINIFSSNYFVQRIKAVAENPLLLEFKCIRNCKHYMFALGVMMHLQVRCIECPPGNVQFSVVNDHGTEISSSDVVIFTEFSKKEISLSAVATLGIQKGATSIKLYRSDPPVNGNCNISPTSGIEFQTIFRISCRGYVDEEAPISYRYSASDTVLDHSGDSTLFARLFPTAGHECEIKIDVCDDIGACTLVKLRVPLSPFKPGGSWLSYLFKSGSNLKDLVVSGDRSTALNLVHSVISNMSPEESFEIAQHIVKTFRELELNRLLAVEQVFTVATQLFDAIKVRSDSVFLISELYSKLSNGLLHSIQTGEVYELQLETHKKMIDKMTQSMTKLTIEVEQFQMVHDAEPVPPEDPFSENYSDYGDLDMENVIHISKWLHSMEKMHKCIQTLGVVSAFAQLPDEAPLVTKSKSITSWTLVVDNSKPISVTWNDSETFISLPENFLKNLGRDQTAVQVLIFKKNPFWWYPEQHKFNTKVLSVGAYTRDVRSLKKKSFKQAFSYFLVISNGYENKDENFIHGVIENHLNMLTYERVISPNEVLVVSFPALDEDIRVLLTIKEKPRSSMLRSAKLLKASKEESTTIYVVNHESTKQVAFLTIAAAGHVKFSFGMNLRSCLTWDSNAHEWTSKYCSVGERTNQTHIHCYCNHLSMFAAKTFPIFALQEHSSDLVDDLHLNLTMITFYTITIILLILLLLLAWNRDLSAIRGLPVLYLRTGNQQNYKYLVTIYTNGHADAATSSNITIQLHGSQGRSPESTLYSSSSYSLFHRNSPTSFVILSPAHLGELRSVSLRHDSFGRYPSWNCHSVNVKDEQTQQEFIFLINKRLPGNESISYTASVSLVKEATLQRRGWNFRNTLTDTFANWYTQQAICSQRMYGPLTAVEKSAIFILRVCITLVGLTIYFGPTTMSTYEEERETYYSMLLDLGEILFIAFFCHSVGVVLGVPFQFFFIKLRSLSVKYKLVFRK